MSSYPGKFARDIRGNFGVLTAILFATIALAIGIAIDVSVALNRKMEIQAAADAAVLWAAAHYEDGMDLASLAPTVRDYLSTNSSNTAELLSGPTLTSDGDLCLSAKSQVPTTFMRIASVEMVPVSVKACALPMNQNQIEIALVLDVSSSMIEQNRFVPMQTAVTSFLNGLASDGELPSNVRISIVPFSSRVNFGMHYSGWFMPYNGLTAIPSRWTNPQSVYSSSKYSFSKWLDGETWLAYTSTNYYWTGCAEPRADVDMRTTGNLTDRSLGDAPPSDVGFVAMDSNPQSAQSFCPPPITELSGDLTALTAVVDGLTSEGSTRLDAGMLAGWYTLSPRWAKAWETGQPLEYGKTAKKYVVFMTDGGMNVKYGPSDTDKLDWLCDKERTSACNKIAVNALLSTCSKMKTAGIKIYSISYSNDADVTNIRDCSSGTGYYYSASVSSIEAVYKKIAEEVVVQALRLSR
ncbi:MAG TPA: pilus assembly protein TadG-related protein [Rhizobium sp.]|nr:pilus assembly protein TadG-related protein [Rhizobium sp.]